MKVRLKTHEVRKSETVLDIGGHTIFVSDLVFIALIAVIAAFAYNVGVHDAQEYIKFAAYMCHGITTPYGAYYCFPTAKNNRVVFVCLPKHSSTNLSNMTAKPLSFLNKGAT